MTTNTIANQVIGVVAALAASGLGFAVTLIG